jgi:transposase
VIEVYKSKKSARQSGKIDKNSIIESVGASVINLSSYSPDFNPIEHWW